MTLLLLTAESLPSQTMSSNNAIVQALTSMSSAFVYEVDQKTTVNNKLVIKASISTEEDVKSFIEEFSAVSGVSYIVSKTHKGDKKAFRKEFVCHHSDLKKRVKSSDSVHLTVHKHKATGCRQRLYVSIKRPTAGVLRHESRSGIDFVARGLVTTLTFTGEHNHCVQTADSGRFLPLTSEAKKTLTDQFREVQGSFTNYVAPKGVGGGRL